MKATLTTRPSKFSPSHRRGKGFHGAYLAVHAGKTVAELRLYWPASVCYACLWVHGKEVYPSGSGSAGGGGYCKASAAAGEAIRNAGFDLSQNIQGAGTRSIEDAMLAVAKAVGFPRAFVVTTHA